MLLNMVGAGAAGGGLPAFTYTGQSQLIDDGKADGKQNWRIKFLTSGMLTFTKAPGAIDVFLVGGGGSGSDGGRTGGAGGYTKTTKGVVVTKGTEYPIVIGAGGTAVTNTNGNAGGNTTAFGSVAAGGAGAQGTYALNKGGSGGGGWNANSSPGRGGSDGSDGIKAQEYGGKGQKSVMGPNGESGSTREFGEADGTLYSGGGGGGSYAAGGMVVPGGEGGGGNSDGEAGGTNTGGGGGSRYTNGSSHYPGGAGGSGIVVIRNTR